MAIPKAPLRTKTRVRERPPGFWERHARAPWWPEVLAVPPLGAGLVLGASRIPSGGGRFAVALAALGGVWLLHLLIALARASEGRYGGRPSAGEWFAWLLLPVTFGVAAGAVAFDRPVRIRFALSEPAFAAVDAGGADAAANAPSRIGLYDVREVRREGGRTWFVTRIRSPVSDSDGWWEYGVVRWPEVRPSYRETRFSRIRSDWFSFEMRRWE